MNVFTNLYTLMHTFTWGQLKWGSSLTSLISSNLLFKSIGPPEHKIIYIPSIIALVSLLVFKFKTIRLYSIFSNNKKKNKFLIR